MPTVSVIIPAFNQARYLAGALQSVLDQSYRDLEIIVIDDGSTDETWSMAQRFGDAIHYIRQNNQGLPSARNRGIRQAQGKYIALLDSDDEWLPQFLESMLSLAARQPEADVYYCNARCVDEQGQELPQLAGGYLMQPQAMYAALLRANFLIPSAVLLRRDAIVEAGLFDQAMINGCEDWDLWLRLLPTHMFVGTMACLVRYRLHGDNFSNDLIKMQQAMLAVTEKHFGSDDGQWRIWTAEKRRAYGGAYRYCALTSLLRQHDWQACAQHLRRALQIDRTLTTDLDLFYELALGTQPLGYRGSTNRLDLTDSAKHIEDLLSAILADPALIEMHRQIRGTAYYGLGLVAYNTHHLGLSRHFFFQALRLCPDLWSNTQIIGDITKSVVGQRGLGWLRRLRRTVHRR
jgi:glycosyltransferase involved in cell wall biosynthesis